MRPSGAKIDQEAQKAGIESFTTDSSEIVLAFPSGSDVLTHDLGKSVGLIYKVVAVQENAAAVGGKLKIKSTTDEIELSKSNLIPNVTSVGTTPYVKGVSEVISVHTGKITITKTAAWQPFFAIAYLEIIQPS